MKNNPTAVHTPTNEILQEVLKTFLSNDISELKDCWQKYGANTCVRITADDNFYSNRIGFASLQFYAENGYSIISFSKFNADHCFSNDLNESKQNTDTIDALDFDYDAILTKYGPEGCYEIAEKLIAIANEDISDSYYDSFK